jgi:serine/threonine protein kinase
MALGRAGDATSPEQAAERHGRFGDFLLLRHLGIGPLGTVHEAWLESMGRKLALKRWNTAGPPDDKGRAGHVPWPAVGLRHPSIVTVHAHGRSEDTLWVAMEFLPEGSLGRWIEAAARRRRRAPLDRGAARRRIHGGVAQIFAATALGLDAAHRHGIVHGGLKPENLLFNEGGRRLMLSDFAPANGTALGAVSWLCELAPASRYTAPEQRAVPREGGPASDIYAFGACLLAALLPERARAEDAPSLPWTEARRAGVPPALRAILRSCLDEDPAKRPTASALSQALGDISR